MDSSPSQPSARCSRCGNPLVEAHLDGLCPACLWTDVFAEPFDEAPGEARAAVPPAAGGWIPIPGHEVLEELARGGMGIVYRARQFDPPRYVALKMLLPHQIASEPMRERFRLEIQAASGLDHPAILPVFQVGEQDGLPWFSMKLAGGGSLAARRGQFTGRWKHIAELLATLADAVQFAHERGVLHRDLKPGNVLFDEGGRPYVSDFGLAKVIGADSDLTRSADFLGTPHYAAPEVTSASARNATTASDVYSLGAILYELLASRPPFEAEGVPALLKKIAEDEVIPPSKARSSRREEALTSQSKIDQSLVTSAATKLPRDLSVICLKCLAKDPARRYATARELAEDLRRWLAGRPILARPATPLERVQSWARRNPARAAVSALLLVVVVSAIALEVRANRRTHRALGESLVAQARLQRGTGRPGQRFDTLELVRQATEIGAARTESLRTQLRTEVAAALALPDAQMVDRWSVPVAQFENEFDFSSDLSRFAAATADGGCTVFSTADRRKIWTLPAQTNNPAVRLRLSPRGDFLAVRYQDKLTAVHSLSVSNTNPVWSSHDPGATVVFPLDGETMVVTERKGRGGRKATVVAIGTGSVEAELPAPDHDLLACDARATRVAFASDRLSVHRVSDANEVWSAQLPAPACAIAWSPDGRRLAAALTTRRGQENDGLNSFPILIFDAETGRLESTFAELPSNARRVAFHPDGDSLAVATWHAGLVWGSVQPDGFRLRMEGSQRALNFSTDGKRLAFSPTADELGVSVLALPSLHRAWSNPATAERSRQSSALSADGRWLAVSGANGLALWDVTKRRQLCFLPQAAREGWTTTAFAEHDSILYYSSTPTGVRRFDLAGLRAASGGSVSIELGRSIGPPEEHLITGLAPDGRGLLLLDFRRQATNDHLPPSVWLWPDGDPTRARKLVEDHPVNGAALIPGTPWLVTTDLVAPDVTIWNVATGEKVRTLGLGQCAVSRSTPDGRWLLTRTRSEYGVWEAISCRLVNRWPTPPEEAQSDFTPMPGAPVVAVSTTDGRLRFRHLPDGGELLTLPAATRAQVVGWIFSPDAQQVFAIPQSGPPLEWDLAELHRELAKLGLDW